MHVDDLVVLRILGCVSPYPTETENCPGYLITIGDKKILLDCGNGVTKELNIPQDLENLNVFISHFHKDHYMDLGVLGYASYVYHNLGILKNKVKVYVPKTSCNDKEYIDYLLIKNNCEQYFDIIEYDENTVFELFGSKISFMKNYHPVNTYSTKIENEYFKLVYTSDLGYKSKDDIIKFTYEADYLLIESSLLIRDNVQNEYHLHAYEAAEIAKLSNVKNLILTHFWPSTAKMNYINEAQQNFEKVIIAETGKKIELNNK